MKIKIIKVISLSLIILLFSFSLSAISFTLTKTELNSGHRLNFYFKSGIFDYNFAFKIDEINSQFLFNQLPIIKTQNFYFGPFNPTGSFKQMLYPMKFISIGNYLYTPSQSFASDSLLSGIVFKPNKKITILMSSPLFERSSLASIGFFYNSNYFFFNDYLLLNIPKTDTIDYQINWKLCTFQKLADLISFGASLKSQYFNSSWYLQTYLKGKGEFLITSSLSLSLNFKGRSLTYIRREGGQTPQPLVKTAVVYPNKINQITFINENTISKFTITYLLNEFNGLKISGRSQKTIYCFSYLLETNYWTYSKTITSEYTQWQEHKISIKQNFKTNLIIKNKKINLSINIVDTDNYIIELSLPHLVIKEQSKGQKLLAKLIYKQNNLSFTFDQDQAFSITYSKIF